MAWTRREVAVACAFVTALAVAAMTAVDMGAARPAVFLVQKDAESNHHRAVTNHKADKQQLLAVAKAKTQALLSTSDFPYTLDKPAGIKAMAARPDDGVASSNIDALKLASQLATRAAGHVPAGDVADRAAGQTELPPQPAWQISTATKPTTTTTHKLAVSAPATHEAQGGQQQQVIADAGGPSLSETGTPSDGSDPVSEIKADDSPIGTAAAAKILGDAEGLEKSNGPEGSIEEWKQAAKRSGPKALDEITDDVTSGNPFPNQAMSEKMEIQDVWNKAQALARPAGKLDGTAKENQATIDNAVAQASAAAYMAANEAAAVDSYDVSMPNPDMMANKKKAALLGQARAASTHASTAMLGRASAVAGRGASAGRRERQALEAPRVQVLAELAEADDAGGGEAMRERAMQDAKMQAGKAKSLRKEYYEAIGAEKEALRLASSQASTMGDVNEGRLAVRESRPAVAQEVPAAVASAAPMESSESGEASSKSTGVKKEAAREELRGALEREGALERKLAAVKRQDEIAHEKAAMQAGDSLGLRAEARKLRAKLSEAQRELGGEGGAVLHAGAGFRDAITRSVASVLGDRRVQEVRAAERGVAAKKVYMIGGNPLEGFLEG